jgi:DNA polymerase I-like protein with 3'-5' exonuclease and polymerase domains
MPKMFLELDYGQIEARTIAMASKDPSFCKALWERYDVHMDWAERIARAYPDRIGGKEYLTDKAVMKTFRGDVKNQWVFPLFYGATLNKVSNELTIAADVLKPLYEEFWKTFSGVKDYQDRMEKTYKKQGYVECLTGRRHRAPLSYNQMINLPIQGTASDIVVDGMDRLSETDVWEYQASLNVHDSLVFVLEENELDDHAETIIKEMLGCKFDFINVPLVVEASVSKTNWSSMEPIGEFASDEWLNFPEKPAYI